MRQEERVSCRAMNDGLMQQKLPAVRLLIKFLYLYLVQNQVVAIQRRLDMTNSDISIDLTKILMLTFQNVTIYNVALIACSSL